MSSPRFITSVGLCGLAGLGAAAYLVPTAAPRRTAATPPPDPIVRTQVVTRRIHRTRHVTIHVKPKPATSAPPARRPVVTAPASAPIAPATVAPAPVSSAPVRPATTTPAVHTGASSTGGGERDDGEREREGGGDD